MVYYIDISNYVLNKAHTGIQRVVREILFRLINDDVNFNYKIVFFNPDIKKFTILRDKDVLDFLKDVKNYEFVDIESVITISELKAGDVFFEIDGVWNNNLKRSFLYKELKQNNVKIFNFIYDLVPILLPQYSHENTTRNFLTFLHSVYQYSDLVLFDSRSAERDFLDIKNQIKNTRYISTRVVKLGSDVLLQNSDIVTSTVTNQFVEKKYILFVGTLEPRKNQALMLDVFEKLNEEYSNVNLIFVGKAGWNNDKLINRIKSHGLLNKSFFWLNDINDQVLAWLYKNAYICVYLSSYEGFGLPIAESLSYGNITVTSRNSSMYEVGKNFADYLIYNSFNELYELLELYLKDNNLYKQKKNYIKSFYHPYSWDLTYHSVVDVLYSYTAYKPVKQPNKLQFVFISIDKNNLEGTIAAIDKYIDFVASYIIVTRKDIVEEMESILTPREKHVIDENLILGQYSQNFAQRDHVSKNWLLRASLLNLEVLQNQFIMLDDDNRPLKNIGIDHFICNGKYSAYYFYDLLEWKIYQTDYDYGQHNMKSVLDQDGYELLSYSSHKPQIIDKKLFSEVVKKYFEIGLKMPIDEWSIYFNYAISKYPFLFNKLVYDTMNWPGNNSDWSLMYNPKEYNFENFYPSIYENGLFQSKFNLEYNDKISLKEKVNTLYNKNKEFHEINKPILQKYNMVHGVLKFKLNSSEIIFSGLPYLIEASGGTWVKIPLNYKALNLLSQKVELIYWIKNKLGHRNKIEIQAPYFESIVEFAISCTTLPAGEYDLLIDIKINDIEVYGVDSPYLLKLNVKGL